LRRARNRRQPLTFFETVADVLQKRFAKPALTSEQIALGQKLLDEGQSARQVAKVLGVHPSTVYRVLSNSV
jgi:DNA invertase Pin-like site-specific DNA recombinase